MGDLIPFLFATRYSLGYTRQEPFRLLAARGFARFHQRLKEAFAGWVEPPPGLMDLRELAPDGPDEVREEGLLIRSAPTNHTEGSLAYRVEAEGRSLVYSGDTDESDSLVDLARGADLLVLEAANPFKVPGHLTPAGSRAPGGQSRGGAGAPDPLLPALRCGGRGGPGGPGVFRRNPAGRRRPEPHRVRLRYLREKPEVSHDVASVVPTAGSSFGYGDLHEPGVVQRLTKFPRKTLRKFKPA